MKSGTWMVAPVSSTAALLPPLTVSPRRRERSSVTWPGRRSRGSSTSAGMSSMYRTSTSMFSFIRSKRPVSSDLGRAICSKVSPSMNTTLIGFVVQVRAWCGSRCDLVELLLGAEGLVDHATVRHVPQLGPHERAALARLDVLEVDDPEGLAFVPDGHAGAELVGRDHSVLASSGKNRRIPGDGLQDPQRSDSTPRAPAAEAGTCRACGPPRSAQSGQLAVQSVRTSMPSSVTSTVSSIRTPARSGT